MSHYECSNCGEQGGVAWGYCPKCTPRPVRDAATELTRATLNAGANFDNAVRALRNEYVTLKISKAQAEYDRLWNEHCPDPKRRR